MKAKIIGLLTLFATISIFRSDSILVQFKLIPFNKDSQNECQKLVNSILKLTFDKFTSDGNFRYLANTIFPAAPLTIDTICNEESGYPEIENIKATYTSLNALYGKISRNNGLNTLDKCLRGQKLLKKIVHRDMLLFLTTLESLNFSIFPDIKDNITNFEIKDGNSATITYESSEKAESSSFANYNLEGRNTKVILDYNTLYPNEEIEITNTQNSMNINIKGDQVKPIGVSTFTEYFNYPKDENFAAGLNIDDNINGKNSEFEKTLDKNLMNGKDEDFSNFLAALNGDDSQKPISDKLAKTTYRDSKPGDDKTAIFALLLDNQYFDKNGSTAGSSLGHMFIIDSIRMQVSPNGIGKVYIDAGIQTTLII